MIQRLVAILMLSLLFLGMGAAVAAPEPGTSVTLEIALDDDSNDELTGSEAGLEAPEAPEATLAPLAGAPQASTAGLPQGANSRLPAAPYLEGPQRPPRAA
ncbi:hypothetical protein J7U46_09985 [Pelomonas sp. V22]|uniref:hypothetical protein n=1 Tax=Pelomonas sp. V22 TaxID=2822139 RepID=UPI0024A88F57|nr:hypothetical protein [Pelomonas sp. V22]MDI4633377.1 hypothetical protein [Pelomonas sp. V22]